VRKSLAFVLALVCAQISGPVHAQSQADLLRDSVEDDVQDGVAGILAVFAISALPNQTANALFLDTGADSNRTFDFRAAQIGGGFTYSETFPLYLEGYLGWSQYNPNVVLPMNGPGSEFSVDLKNYAATGGVGWDFGIAEHLFIRPVFMFSVGRVEAEAQPEAGPAVEESGLVGARDEGFWAGGVGASAALVYQRDWPDGYSFDASLRHTYLHLEPVGSGTDVSTNADAITTILWSRLRMPSGLTFLRRPLRGVVEVAASHNPGDQGAVLDTEWLVQAGGGIEINFEDTSVPLVKRTRLLLRYTQGENVNGFSVGFGLSF